MLHDDRDAATLRYRPAYLVEYARRHDPRPVCVTCVSALCRRYALCGLKISSYEHFVQQFIFHRVNIWDRLNLFFSRMTLSQSGFHVTCSVPWRRRGDPPNRLDVFDFESAARGPRGEGEGEAHDWRVPGRFPVGRGERRRDLPCEAVAKTARRSKKTQLHYVIQGSPSGIGVIPVGCDASWHAGGSTPAHETRSRTPNRKEQKERAKTLGREVTRDGN